jgi:hypothetical protein
VCQTRILVFPTSSSSFLKGEEISETIKYSLVPSSDMSVEIFKRWNSFVLNAESGN